MLAWVGRFSVEGRHGLFLAWFEAAEMLENTGVLGVLAGVGQHSIPEITFRALGPQQQRDRAVLRHGGYPDMTRSFRWFVWFRCFFRFARHGTCSFEQIAGTRQDAYLG